MAELSYPQLPELLEFQFHQVDVVVTLPSEVGVAGVHPAMAGGKMSPLPVVIALPLESSEGARVLSVYVCPGNAVENMFTPVKPVDKAYELLIGAFIDVPDVE